LAVVGEGRLKGASPTHAAPLFEQCDGAWLKVISAILERSISEKILVDLGLDPQSPPKGRARERNEGRDFAA
jgi:hypothetical protein